MEGPFVFVLMGVRLGTLSPRLCIFLILSIVLRAAELAVDDVFLRWSLILSDLQGLMSLLS